MAFPPRFGMPPMGMPRGGMFMPTHLGRGMHNAQSNRPPPSSQPQAYQHGVVTSSHDPKTTTVFVGNISEKCTDEFMRQMLDECGTVASWKRISGSNGKLQAFGFCNFESPEGTLRSLRILNDFQVGEKKLTVKVEDKVRDELRKWALKMRKLMGKPDLKLKDGELPADEEDLKKDEEIRLKLLSQIEQEHPELISIAEVSDGELSEKNGKSKKEKGKEGGKDKERARRHSHSSASPSETKKKKVEEANLLMDYYRNSRPARRSHSRDGKRNKSKTPKRSRRRSYSGSSSSSSSGSSSDSDSSRSSHTHRSRSVSRRSKRSYSRNRSDSEDSQERRATKRMIKEKERAYMNRLHKWEVREKQKARQYEKEERKDKEMKKSILKEAKRLKHFLEDYDDEKDDPKYYKSSSLFQRKREFEREKEADQKDRIKEQQEIEELKKQIQAENADKDEKKIEEEARKRHKQREEAALKKLRADSGSPNPHQPLGHSQKTGGESSSSSESEDEADKTTNGGDLSPAGSMTMEVGGVSAERRTAMDDAKREETRPIPEEKPPAVTTGGWKTVASPVTPNAAPATLSAAVASPLAKTISPGPLTPSTSTQLISEQKPPTTTSAGSAQTQPSAQTSQVKEPPKNDISKRLNGVFGNFEEEEEIIVARKKLKPFEITKEDRIKHMTPEEKKRLIKDLIAKIPTEQTQLFAYNIDWTYVDDALISQRIRPWVARKVSDYLGEEEASLVEFVCDKIKQKSPADAILKDIAVILDEDAAVFVMKLWRLVIYESEANKLGYSTSGGGAA